MNCEQYQETISQFIDGELDSTGESSLFRHLGSCDHCRTFLKNILSLRNTLTGTREIIIPASLDQKVLRQPVLQQPFWLKTKTQYSTRAITLAIIFSVLTSSMITSLWYTSQQPQHTIVCLTPLPEVEVTGYVVIGHPPIKGHQQ
jgi:anti-sigma factor RsiW